MLRKIISIIFVLILSGCGGGGGSSGTNPGKPFTVSIPSTLTLNVGEAQQFAVAGGAAPYSVNTTNASVAVASVNGGTVVIGGVGNGIATVTVRDSAGVALSTSVTVGTGGAVGLYIAAPSSVTLVKGTASEYGVGGGKPPYKAVSSNASVVSAALSGTTLFLTASNVGSATILVTDSVGTSVTLTVTSGSVPSVALVAQPSSASASVGDKLNFVLSGGVPGYSASVVSPSIASAVVLGSQLQVSLLKAGSTQIIISDSQGNTFSISVAVVAATTTSLSVAPAGFVVSENGTETVSLGIAGGTAPYSAYTNNLLLSNVTVSGSSASVGLGTQGSRCVAVDTSITITVVDSLGASSTSAMTIKDNNGLAGCTYNGATALAVSPSAFRLSENSRNPIVLSVSGGTAPYTVFTSDLALSSVSVSGSSVTINLGTQGSRCVAQDVPVTITVVDSVGVATTSVMTVADNNGGVGCAPLAVLDSSANAVTSVTLAAGGSRTLAISGVAGPFTAATTNSAVATAGVGGSGSLIISGVAAGTATIVVRDANGAQTNVSVTVQ